MELGSIDGARTVDEPRNVDGPTLQSFRSGNSRTRFMSKLWKRPYAPVKKGHRYMHFTGNIREYSERITTYTLNMVLVFHYYVKRFHSISKLWFGNLQKNALYEPYPEKCWNRFSIFTNWFRIGSGLGRNPLQCMAHKTTVADAA